MSTQPWNQDQEHDQDQGSIAAGRAEAGPGAEAGPPAGAGPARRAGGVRLIGGIGVLLGITCLILSLTALQSPAPRSHALKSTKAADALIQAAGAQPTWTTTDPQSDALSPRTDPTPLPAGTAPTGAGSAGAGSGGAGSGASGSGASGSGSGGAGSVGTYPPPPAPRPKVSVLALPAAKAHPAAKPKAKPKKATPKPAIAAAVSRNVHLRNVTSGKCLSLRGGAVSQYACGGSGETWRLQPTRSADGHQLYRLRSSTGACLDPPNYGAEPETTQLASYTCTNPSSSDNQEWSLEDTGTASRGHKAYALVNYDSGLCLDVEDWASDHSSDPSGRNITLYQCHDTSWGWDDHRWIVTT